jgi:hypothetical protein
VCSVATTEASLSEELPGLRRHGSAAVRPLDEHVAELGGVVAVLDPGQVALEERLRDVGVVVRLEVRQDCLDTDSNAALVLPLEHLDGVLVEYLLARHPERLMRLGDGLAITALARFALDAEERSACQFLTEQDGTARI